MDPDHPGRGIGRALGDELERTADGLHAARLWASARADDPRALRFLRHRGFVEKSRSWQSHLDVEAAVARDAERGPARLPEGIEFTTLADEGAADDAVVDRVHALAAATMGDAPRLGPYVPLTREQFVGMMLSGAGYLPEGVLLARAGDRYVGISNLGRVEDEPGVLHQMFTATLPEFRRRGIATELKRRGVRFARARGFQVIRTWNDSLNEAIWSINERMGYWREREMVWTEKALGGV